MSKKPKSVWGSTIPLFKVLMSNAASEAVREVLSSGYTGQGRRCEDFEIEFQKEVEAPIQPLLTNSCTSALDLAYHLIGIQPEDEVIVTPQTCSATAIPLLHRKAKIVWADVNAVTGLMIPQDVKSKITSKTKAIVAVDWGGLSCDYDELKSFGIPVVQDAAHSFMGRYKGESIAKTGGDYICWSFQSIKHLSMGDGGALMVPKEQYERAKLLRWYGFDRESRADFRCEQNLKEAGYKYQSNDIAAAIGLSNLKIAIDAVEKQRENAAYYCGRFESASNFFRLTYTPESSWWLYTIVLNGINRDSLIKELADRSIAASPVHSRLDRHDCFGAFKRNDLTGLEYFSSRELAIPVGWWLSSEERKYIADTMLELTQ